MVISVFQDCMMIMTICARPNLTSSIWIIVTFAVLRILNKCFCEAVDQHTYIFISQIQSLHQLHLNMKHVNKYQTTQSTKKNRGGGGSEKNNYTELTWSLNMSHVINRVCSDQHVPTAWEAGLKYLPI
jgi:hypothetical protein